MADPAASDVDVVAGALAAACRAPEVLARLAGPLGDAARAASWIDTWGPMFAAKALTLCWL